MVARRALLEMHQHQQHHQDYAGPDDNDLDDDDNDDDDDELDAATSTTSAIIDESLHRPRRKFELKVSSYWAHKCLQDIREQRANGVKHFLQCNPECPMPYHALQHSVARLKTNQPLGQVGRRPILGEYLEGKVFEQVLHAAQSGRIVPNSTIVAIACAIARERQDGELDDTAARKRLARCRASGWVQCWKRRFKDKLPPNVLEGGRRLHVTDLNATRFWANKCLQDVRERRVKDVKDFVRYYPNCPLSYQVLCYQVARLKRNIPIGHGRRRVLDDTLEDKVFEQVVQAIQAGQSITYSLIVQLARVVAGQQLEGELDDSAARERVRRCSNTGWAKGWKKRYWARLDAITRGTPATYCYLQPLYTSPSSANIDRTIDNNVSNTSNTSNTSYDDIDDEEEIDIDGEYDDDDEDDEDWIDHEARSIPDDNDDGDHNDLGRVTSSSSSSTPSSAADETTSDVAYVLE